VVTTREAAIALTNWAANLRAWSADLRATTRIGPFTESRRHGRGPWMILLPGRPAKPGPEKYARIGREWGA
jgi:hypothetical protein